MDHILFEDHLSFGGGDVRRGGLAILVALSLATAGCSVFGKKKPDAQQPPPPLPPQTAAAATPTGNTRGGPFSTTSNPKAPLPNASGMLAGRVICSYDRQPPPTIIQVSATGEKTSDGKPQEITTDTEGYFTIQGLVPGQGYQLTARTREGDVKMGGITFAIAPNPRVLIRISEEFAPTNTGGSGGNKKADRSTGANDTSNTDPPNRTLGAPTPIGSTAEDNPSRPDPAGGTGGNQVAARDRGDRERIPLSIGAGRGPPPAGGGDYGASAPVTARVPSCALTGRQLDNFALYDLTGLPWEYRNHRGRLVLLDFWGTWCGWCVKGIPDLVDLHIKYAKDGLEIVGIAYEQPATALQQAKQVQAVRDQKQIPYRILMGSNIYDCPVKSQFGVTSFPSMFLLDENNRIIWKMNHALREQDKRDLEQIIRQHLLAH